MVLVLLFIVVVLLVLLAIWVYRLRKRSGRAGDDAIPASVISPRDAEAGARKGFEDYGLFSRADWKPLLVNAVVPMEPLLVKRLDAIEMKDAYFYLVPFGAPGAIGAAARVDGVSGEYLESSAFVPRGTERPWGAMIADWQTEAATRRQIVERKFVPKQGDTFVVDPHGVEVHPTFVWKPCYESRSPFYPFRMVTIGGRVRFVRIDGVMFDTLTDLGYRRPKWLDAENRVRSQER